MEENISKDCKRILNLVEPFYYNERVDVIHTEKEIVIDAQIASIRGNIIVVRFIESGEVENIHIDDNIILKQCMHQFNLGKPGRPMKKMNRIDIKSNDKNYYEGFIIDVTFYQNSLNLLGSLYDIR